MEDPASRNRGGGGISKGASRLHLLWEAGIAAETVQTPAIKQAGSKERERDVREMEEMRDNMSCK